jgi:hypothetical protein
MKQRSLSENTANLTQPFDSSYKRTSRPGVCQINSVNLNLTARIKVQTLEIYWALLVCLICRNMLKDLNEILKQNTKLSPS